MIVSSRSVLRMPLVLGALLVLLAAGFMVGWVLVVIAGLRQGGGQESL